MLVALAVVAMVLFTGVSIRAATGGIVGAVRWSAAMARDRTGLDDDEEVEEEFDEEDEPTDPFGRRVAPAPAVAPLVDEDEDEDEERSTRTRTNGRRTTLRSPSRSRNFCRWPPPRPARAHRSR